MTVFRPSDAAETEEVVTWAAAEAQPLEIIGGGSKRGFGRPPAGAHTLDLAALSGIVDYDPSELVLSARAATPMQTIAAALDAEGQMLAFEPPAWRDLLGGDGTPTLGGVLACNLSGPRRARAGAARDHVLGLRAVNGWGDRWKAGGRVVKNVTGYDMCKLQAGAFGTLSVMTEVTVKVLPRPETSCSVILPGRGDEAAIRDLASALNAPHEVSAAAHLPAEIAARSAVAPAVGAGLAVTVLRLEGPGPSVAYRAAALERMFPGGARLPEAESIRLWREIGEVHPLLAKPGRIIWRLCPTPALAPGVLHRLRAACPSAEGFYDWGGGLLWLGMDADGVDCGAARVRAMLREAGGHATLLRAPDVVRETVAVFQPQSAPLEALTRRVKAGFDPRGILNPGRMQKGI